MKMLATLGLSLLVGSAYADTGSLSVLDCKDATSRQLTVSQLTGNTGGIKGTYVGQVLKNGKATAFPETLTRRHVNSNDPITFDGANIHVSIPVAQTSDLSFEHVRGSLKVTGDKTPVGMVCTVGPAYDKK